MKKYVLAVCLSLSGILFASEARSQDDTGTEREEIIIRKKGDFPNEVNIQLKGDQVTINGKKPEDVEGNIEVIRRKFSGKEEGNTYGFSRPSPFGNLPRGFSFQGRAYSGNKALLGVLSVPDDSSEGARIEEVEKGTPADSAGLQKGDVITKIDDSDIGSAEDLTQAIGQYDPGNQIKVTYLRGKKSYTTEVQLGKNDNQGMQDFGLGGTPYRRFYFQGPPSGGGQGDMPNFMQQFRRSHPFMDRGGAGNNASPRLGMTVENNGENNGVTVRSVQPGSAAEKSGFKPGDVISGFGGKEIANIDDMAEAIHSHQQDESVKATVVRNGKTQTLDVQMPSRHERADL